MNALLRGELNAIGRRYIWRTMTELEVLRQNVAALKTGLEGPRTSLARQAHRISGSAAMFGFDSVSDCAARIERLVAALGEDVDPDATITQIDTIAVELDRAVRTAARSSGVG